MLATSSALYRVHVDIRRENLNHKIRDAQLQKVPYMLVIGDREAAEDTASVRLRSGENLGAIPSAELFERFQAESRS